jgi:hypothetical protein
MGGGARCWQEEEQAWRHCSWDLVLTRATAPCRWLYSSDCTWGAHHGIFIFEYSRLSLCVCVYTIVSVMLGLHGMRLRALGSHDEELAKQLERILGGNRARAFVQQAVVVP